MNIGVVGLGIVGSAVKVGFEELGNDVFGHDLTLDTNLRDVLDTDICYICVPTPPSENGSCDVSIVESVVRDLSALNYNGLVIIKSTVELGTSGRLSSKYKNFFLRTIISKWINVQHAVETTWSLVDKLCVSICYVLIIKR